MAENMNGKVHLNIIEHLKSKMSPETIDRYNEYEEKRKDAEKRWVVIKQKIDELEGQPIVRKPRNTFVRAASSVIGSSLMVYGLSCLATKDPVSSLALTSILTPFSSALFVPANYTAYERKPITNYINGLKIKYQKKKLDKVNRDWLYAAAVCGRLESEEYENEKDAM